LLQASLFFCLKLKKWERNTGHFYVELVAQVFFWIKSVFGMGEKCLGTIRVTLLMCSLIMNISQSENCSWQKWRIRF